MELSHNNCQWQLLSKIFVEIRKKNTEFLNSGVIFQIDLLFKIFLYMYIYY